MSLLRRVSFSVFDTCGAGDHEKNEDDSSEYSDETDASACVLDASNEALVDPIPVPHRYKVSLFIFYLLEMKHLLLRVDVVERVHVERAANAVLVEVLREAGVRADGRRLDGAFLADEGPQST